MHRRNIHKLTSQALDILCAPHLVGCCASIPRVLRSGDLSSSVSKPLSKSVSCPNSNDFDRLLRRKAQRLRKETGDDRWKAPIEKLHRSVAQTVMRSLYRPMLLLALEPMCLNLCIFSAILLGILYLFFGAFNLVFTNVYHFNLWEVGLTFMGLFVGMVVAILTDPIWRRFYVRLELKHEKRTGVVGDFQPEWRLPPGECFTTSSLVKTTYADKG